MPTIASLILPPQVVVPINGYHAFDFGRLIFLPQSFLKNIAMIAKISLIKPDQSRLVKSNSMIIVTASPMLLAAPAIPFAISTAAITSPAISLTRFIVLVIPLRIRLVTPLTAESTPLSLSAILSTICVAILLANAETSDIAACTSPNHIGFFMQKMSKIISRNIMIVLITIRGTKLEIILTILPTISAMSLASISFSGARIPAIPPARKFMILPMCSITLSPAIFLPVAREMNPPGPDAMVAAMLPNSVSIRSRSVPKPSPAGPATPSLIDCFSTGGLVGLVTALPGRVSSAADKAPRDSS